MNMIAEYRDISQWKYLPRLASDENLPELSTLYTYVGCASGHYCSSASAAHTIVKALCPLMVAPILSVPTPKYAPTTPDTKVEKSLRQPVSTQATKLKFVKSVHYINQNTNGYSWVDHRRDMQKVTTEEAVPSHTSYSLTNRTTDWCNKELTSTSRCLLCTRKDVSHYCDRST